MKRLEGQSTENTFGVFGFEVLTSEEMNELRGGTTPKSRDKDILDVEDDG
jgi:hypothetical protein